MKTPLFALAALTLAAAQGSVFAAPSTTAPTADVLQARAEAHAVRMRLIGLTARGGEQPTTLEADASRDVPQTPAQRQQQYEQRMQLIGRTVQSGETPAPPVAESQPATGFAARVQQYEQRMALIGRTVQPGEVHAQVATDSELDSKAFSDSRKKTVSAGQ